MVTKCIFQSGDWWCASRGFSHRRSVLADMNALRNLPRQHVPTVMHQIEKAAKDLTIR